MDRFRDRFVIHAAALTLAFGAAVWDRGLAAQVSPEPGYGTVAESSFYVGGSAFHGATAGSSVINFNGSAIFSGAGSYGAWAPISLPQGAVITGVDFDYYDADSLHNLDCYVYEVPRTGSLFQLVSVSTSFSPGFGRASQVVSPGRLVNNGDNSYMAYIEPSDGTTTSNLMWRGVRVRYKLQVSPAPGVATFTDVPTSYWAFQYIEALKASGITQGVTPTTFEPEGNVTRAQMAVFLAKALGLHWPN